MHELAIAQDLLETILQVAKDNNAQTVISARVRAGVCSGVNDESLRFGFDALAEETLARGCDLQIVRVPQKVACQKCEWAGEVLEMRDPFCPECGMTLFPEFRDRQLILETVNVE
jgi:hydrogenase nickel incorporation protein HypA/HybF